MKINSLAVSTSLMMAFRVCEAATIVGTTIPPYPQGWKHEQGACIAHVLGMERMCQYSLGILASSKDKLVYVGKKPAHADENAPKWIVTDVMPYPAVPRKHYFTFATCQQHRKHDETILAIVYPQKNETEWHNRIRLAYRVNLVTGLFERIPTKGVRCSNEGWGL